MNAQVYFDDPENPVIRIFPKGFSQYIAELPIRSQDLTTKEADKVLRKIGIRRREKWIKTDWGYDAKIRFK